MLTHQCQQLDNEAGFEYKLNDLSKKSEPKLFLPVEIHQFKCTDLSTQALRICETAVR